MADISVFDFGDGVERNVKDATARSGLTGKADKVTGATNGNLAKLDSNGNLQDSGVAAGNVVQKSSTTGLLKNDGSVDTHTYVQTSSTAGLLKNDGTVDTTTYASEAGTESLIDSTVGWTGKNELINRGASITTNNVTVTINSDKSITVSTTAEGASANTGVNINAHNQIYLKRGTYIWSSAHDSDDSIGSNVTHNMVYTYLYNVNGGSAWIPSSEPLTSRILNITDETKPVYCRLYVGSGTIITTPITFYPMIRSASITDPTYEPYHKSVEECKADNSVIAPVENGATASQAYAQGAHFIRDGKFCTASTSIASGATLTKNTNYTEGDVASALSSGGGGGEVYPTTETKIGTFAGLDLYRRCFRGNITSGGTAVSSDLKNDYLIVSLAGVYTNGDNVTYALPFYKSSNNYVTIEAIKTSYQSIQSLSLSHPSGVSSGTYIVVVDYTKSTPT